MNHKRIKEIVRRIKLGHPNKTALEILQDMKVVIGYFRTDMYQELPKGCYYKSKGIKVVLTHPDLGEYELNLVYIHELAHCILHPNINTLLLEKYDPVYVEKVENEVDIFISEFLIDDDIIEEYPNFDIYAISGDKNIPINIVKLKGENLKKSIQMLGYDYHLEQSMCMSI